MLCEYGCGQEAKFVVGSKRKNCCSESISSCPELRRKNSEGLKKAYSDGRKNCNQFDGKRGWSKGKSLTDSSDIFTENSKYSSSVTKERLLKDGILPYSCSCCNISEWQNAPIVLELDHINGIGNDNRIVNLRLLCPNCHSQTPTFRGKGINGKKKVSDADLLTAYQNSSNIRQALISVGLVPKGGNYNRMMKLIAASNNIE